MSEVDGLSKSQRAITRVRGVIPNDIPEHNALTWLDKKKPRTPEEPSEQLRQRGLIKPLGED